MEMKTKRNGPSCPVRPSVENGVEKELHELPRALGVLWARPLLATGLVLWNEGFLQRNLA